MEELNAEWKGSGDCRQCRRKPYCGAVCKAHKQFMKAELARRFVNACADAVNKRYGGKDGKDADEKTEGPA